LVAYVERYQKASLPLIWDDVACPDGSPDRLAVTSLAGDGVRPRCVATSAPGLGAPLPHLRRDCAH
jgi:hypothetical protein